MKILFISHGAQYGGAEIVLLNLIRWLKEKNEYTCDILVQYEGPLMCDFEGLGKVFLWNPSQIVNPLELSELHNSIAREINNQNYDLIYANSVFSAPPFSYLLSVNNKIKSIFHIHELEYAISLSNQSAVEFCLFSTDSIIAASKLVKIFITGRYGLPEKKTCVIYSPLVHQNSSNTENIRKKYSISSSAFLVGGSGSIEWRKGLDIFLQIVSNVVCANIDRDVVFMWVGGDFSSDYGQQILWDIKRLGLEKHVIFTGNVNNPEDFYSEFDLFLLPSREDPFPLVCLENANLGNPVVCFDRDVGSTEFIDDSCGRIVKYLSIKEMSFAVKDFCNNENLLNTASKSIQSRSRSFSLDKIAPLVDKLLLETFNSKPLLKNAVSDYFITEKKRGCLPKKINSILNYEGKFLLYGAGEHTEMLFKYTKLACLEILAIVDKKIDHNPLLPYEVISPKKIFDYDFDYILISSDKFCEEIRSELIFLGVDKSSLISFY